MKCERGLFLALVENLFCVNETLDTGEIGNCTNYDERISQSIVSWCEILDNRPDYNDQELLQSTDGANGDVFDLTLRFGSLTGIAGGDHTEECEHRPKRIYHTGGGNTHQDCGFGISVRHVVKNSAELGAAVAGAGGGAIEHISQHCGNHHYRSPKE